MLKERLALVHTLGCRLNSADSALLYDRLTNAGYTLCEKLDADAVAPLIVLNSCAVTAEAVRKSRQALRRFRREFPDAILVVAGCGADADRTVWTEADLVLPNEEKSLLIERLQHQVIPARPFAPVFSERATGHFPFRSRAFIKIQEGCNNFCTYCIVPYVRGRERSRAFAECIEDCRNAIRSGFPELVLTGVNTCAYLDGDRTLGDLLDQVCALEGDFRVRLSSTEPEMHNLSLLDAMARNPKVCRFLHLSLQHGADSVLQRMHRHYSTSEYADFVAGARAKLPGIHIGTDFIVGFPGETDQEFAEACAFVERMAFANAHLFRYSPRPGTPAAEYANQVPRDVADRRFAELETITKASAHSFASAGIGCAMPVIFERKSRDGFCHGWSDHYLPVAMRAATLRRIVEVTPARLDNDILYVE